MKYRFLVTSLSILFSFCFVFNSHGQDPARNSDSLILQLNLHPTEDSTRVDLYNAITFYYYGRDPQAGIPYGKEGIALGRKLGYKKGVANCLISTGVCFWAVADYPSALDMLLQALKIFEQLGDKTGISRAAGNLGNVYAEQKDYPKAMTYYTLALSISRELKDTLGIARKLGNIGTILKEQQKYDEALLCYLQSLENYRAKNEKRGIAVTLANIAWVYAERSQYREALDYYSQSLEIALEAGENRWIMYNYGAIAELYLNMATNDTSVNYLPVYRSLSGAEKERYLNLAIGFSQKAIEKAKEIRAVKQLISWYNVLSSAYMNLGDYQLAYRSVIISHRISDSLFDEDMRLKIASLDAARENEVKAKEIEVQRARLEMVNTQRLAFALGFLAILIIALIIYLSRRKSEKLLLNMLPAHIARRLKRRERPIADRFEEAAVVFTDIVRFTQFSAGRSPEYIVSMLTDFFIMMDALAEKHGMEKIKTIGDRYMAVCGLAGETENVVRAARFALDVRAEMQHYQTDDGQPIRIRIGMDAGPVVAGVIGDKKFSYDLWGDTVNTASRMESMGIEGEIQVTGYVHRRLSGMFPMRFRGEIEVKGKGMMEVWLMG